MEFTANFADPVNKCGFYIHVNILKFFPVFKLAVPYIAVNFLKTFHDLLGIGLCNDPLPCEHLGMGDTAFNIILPEPPVERYRFSIVLHDLCGSFSKSA